MAWQPQSAMAGNGGMGGGSMDVSNGGGQPQGTEYTLQGQFCMFAGRGRFIYWRLIALWRVELLFVLIVIRFIGVMRFLQTEWHRHERDRNAWEIERAEMKSRIGRLEGDARTSKRMHESLGKHVRILEVALKKEREKSSKLAAGEKIEPSVDPKEVAKKSLKALEKSMELDASTFIV